MAIPELQAFIRLLQLAEIDYTYSPDKEVCCGAPIWEDTIELVDMKDERRKEIQDKCKGFMEINNSLGRQAQAKNMIYACHNCASLARRTFAQDSDHHFGLRSCHKITFTIYLLIDMALLYNSNLHGIHYD
ncbi:hypothetical protein [Desulfobacterium sp. N47]|uniref:hypothetical protein n=1 Tax=Desulfobacterium sp. N47 TaxID=3115210 RepID=UPI003C9A4D09